MAEVEGRMNAEQYVDILEENLLPSMQDSGILEEEFINPKIPTEQQGILGVKTHPVNFLHRVVY